MTAKKKSTKPAGPSPLLKLKFEKFPDKQIPVFFDTAKRSFRAAFGFSEYEALSVGQLEGKIKAAITQGATPDVVWEPVIEVISERLFERDTPHEVGADCSFQIRRCYMAITDKGLVDVNWDVPEKSRRAKASETYDFPNHQKLKQIPKLPVTDERYSWKTYMAYTLEKWEKLRAIIGQIEATRKSLSESVKRGDLAVFIPKAAAAPAHEREKATPPKPQTATKPKPDKAIAPKPKSSKTPNIELFPGLRVTYKGAPILLRVGPLPAFVKETLTKLYPELRNVHLLNDGRIQLVLGLNGACSYLPGDLLQEQLDLAEKKEPKPDELTAAAKSTAVGNLSKRSRSKPEPDKSFELASLANKAMQMEKLKPGSIPGILLLAAGFPEGATGELYKDGYVIVNTAAEPTQEFSKAQLIEKIRERLTLPDKNSQPSLLQEAGD